MGHVEQPRSGRANRDEREEQSFELPGMIKIKVK